MKLIDKIYAWCFETIKKEEKEQPVYIPASELFLKNYKTQKTKKLQVRKCPSCLI